MILQEVVETPDECLRSHPREAQLANRSSNPKFRSTTQRLLLNLSRDYFIARDPRCNASSLQPGAIPP
jgi:hypothetical protein